MSSRQHLYLIGVGAACFIGGVWLAYILFGNVEKKRRKKDMPPGLVNLGYTTCYCNTILQCLAPLDGFGVWLETIVRRFGTLLVHHEVMEILKALNGKCDEDVELLSAEKLLSKLNLQEKFQYFVQQDCHEFFQLFCEKLQSSISSSKYAARVSLDPEIRQPEIPRPKSSTKFPLNGRISSRLYCSKCNTLFPTSVEMYVSLTLFVPATLGRSAFPNKSMSINDLLLLYTADEYIQDAMCEKCKEKCCIKKQTKIFSVPSILCFHISRSSWQEMSASKRFDSVSFPEYLDMSPYMQYRPNTNSEYVYRLKSVITHYGSLTSNGHFVAFRRSTSSRKWCFTSDDDVKFVKAEQVFSSQPYMLFYEKCALSAIQKKCRPEDNCQQQSTQQSL